jgi:23S rRNA (uridine2552-2'-O)-methyltransferase
VSTTGKRKGKSRAWLDRQNNDLYVKKARSQGLRARASFKLEEIDKKYKLIKGGMRVVDLGAAPGSWSEYVVKKLSGKGQVVAIDLLEFEPIKDVEIIQGDFTEPESIVKISQCVENQAFDLVLSDMAPNITGVAMQDQARYERLLLSVIDFCEISLRPGGCLLTKFFEGQSAQEVRKALQSQFQTLKVIKPDASRNFSKEIYLLALNRK